MISIFESLRNDRWSKYYFFSFVGLLIIFFISQTQNKAEMKPADSGAVESVPADTLIPLGFTLVPIQLSNAEAISAMMGEFAIVDLFSTPELPTQKGQLIAKDIKLLRAPQQQNQFAVLISEQDTEKLFQKHGGYFAVLRNNRSRGVGKIQTAASPNKKTITYYGEK